ncbi:MAG: GntR family transcriptional regulator [Firmicutes bacterium]|nr:GntR family transcriptional regulator [Bacillota bacterium]
MSWELNADRPLYAQLIEQIELKICAGVYPPGSRLPSVRELAREVSVNPNTMQRALAGLEESGLLYTQRTSGRFVTEDRELVKRVKHRLVREHARAFLAKMLRLGFDHEEIMAALSMIMKESEK